METFPHDVPTDEENVANLFGLETPSFDDPVDTKESKEIITRSLPPSGIYTRDPEELGNLTVITQSKDYEDTRRMIILSGRFRGTFKGKEVTAFVRNIKLSPDRRSAKEFVDGKPSGNFLDKDDTPSLLWAKAVEAYTKTYKEEPTTKQSVINFLESGEYQVKIRGYNGELYVREFLPKRGNGRG